VLARPAAPSAHQISAVGHAHIDTAWLWPLRETRRKAARTFASAVQLAQEYPRLVFVASQAQQYQWIREQHPQLWQRILKAVADGTFVPTGGMWVESDANLPGGEALARQLVYGKRFFLDAFGVETHDVWLPDSFGYTPALPQLARLAGNEWFLTQKLSWNSANRMPHSTFWWEGIDGSRVFTHMPPVDTYNAELSGAELARAERQFRDAGPASRSLVPFGYGDGGGGPTREMLERAVRLHDLDGSPVVRLESPSEFFSAAQAEYADTPTWVGELYLELHRGTYTTQAKNKAGNRRSEHLLREAELWATSASVYSGDSYPHEALERIWQQVLTLQFHDILPGSAIAWVNREAREAYEQIEAELQRLIETSAIALPGTGRTLLNAGPFPRAEVAVVDDADGTGQQLADGRKAVWAEAPALGAGRPSAPPTTIVRVRTDGALTIMDNEILRVTIDGDGLLRSVVDLRIGRDVIPSGQRANLLQLHPDHPAKWDAWDLDRHYRNAHIDLVGADSIAVVDGGPLVARVSVNRSYRSTVITQTYYLAAGSSRVDIETEVDWRESEKVLKAAFPLDVHTERSTAEIQFGHLHRPIHDNTSWDDARFEIWAHRWLHVGEPDYGVALCNDAIYGHDVTRSRAPKGGTVTTVRLTLLRAPHTPDPGADQDIHRFTYALVPGATIPMAIREGYRLNLPLRASDHGGELPSIVAVDHAGVVIEAVKLADDRSGDVVVRLYEAHGNRANTILMPSFAVSSASTTDLLERPQSPAELTSGGVAVTLRPFQILTIRLARA
jgi:alpha-mannosidase